MRLHEEIHYEATPEAVFAVLSDPAFLEARCRAAGALEHSHEVRDTAGTVTVSVRRVVPTAGLPDFVARIVGARMAIVETSVWQPPGPGGARHASVDVSIENAPVSMSGVSRLAGDPGGTVQVLEADLVARVPLFGRAVEQAAAPVLGAAVRAEAALAARWLAAGA